MPSRAKPEMALYSNIFVMVKSKCVPYVMLVLKKCTIHSAGLYMTLTLWIISHFDKGFFLKYSLKVTYKKICILNLTITQRQDMVLYGILNIYIMFLAYFKAGNI